MSALLAVTAVTPATAQIETGQDSLVNVAFRKVAADDVLGGVSSVNYRELMKKNYNTYSLDNLQGYVAGFNGNGMWGLEGSSEWVHQNSVRTATMSTFQMVCWSSSTESPVQPTT